MSNQSLVSVVLIFLNADRFLQEAINSVFAQKYPCWELMLVDDGSSDLSTAIARRCAERHPNCVVYLEHPGHSNLGMSASRNLGIRSSHGAYIAFLDADDCWNSNALEEQVAVLESHREAAMVYGPIEWWYSWRGNAGDRQRDYVEELGVPANTIVPPPRLLPLFLRNKAAVPSGVLIRREIIEQVGGFEDTFRGEYEDQVLCAKICLRAPIFASGQCWYRYRQHPDSCVLKGQRSGETHSARLRFLDWLAQYLSEQKVEDRGVWRALSLEFWRYRKPRAFRLLKRWDRFAKRIKGLLASYDNRKWYLVRLGPRI